MATLAAALALCGAGCEHPQQIVLRYHLAGVDESALVRVETRVLPTGGGSFSEDVPYQSSGTGVGWEVRAPSPDAPRELIVSHDAALGFVFSSDFRFTLVAPRTGTPPRLGIVALANSATVTIGSSAQITAAFPGTADLEIAGGALCGSQTCDLASLCCDGACVDPATDGANCGTCGNACGTGEQCSGGKCRCGGDVCTAGATCCPGLGCVDTRNDPFHCGSCGAPACGNGERCDDGVCRCGNLTGGCGPGSVCCGSSCSAPGNGCVCGSGQCTTNQLCCDAECRNFLADNNNCGSCGVECKNGTSCDGGHCVCNDGRLCAGDGAVCCGNHCAILATSTDNCGACGVVCATGARCTDGSCLCGTDVTQLCVDPAIHTCCGGTACIDTSRDPKNCGACAMACTDSETCTDGACTCGQVICPDSLTCCGVGACVDTQSDAKNCGICGKTCTATQRCCGGVCKNIALPCAT